ncbi:MAG TPA: acyl-CoA synthetase FdrA [Desulfitobacterium dehalogenans]|uniref:Acyl-CoA synthetase FdrA n=1 Tax=Desulfitobacterium dehalogenans TaxID=36854 RepID=A0A7C6Z5C8_9FIRM|nr:acyl-CoA synthetase FdrA [Desulfitobacterium dehalogenans]
MSVRNSVKKNSYQDSVRLMRISGQLKKIAGVINASVMMATDANKRVMEMAGLLGPEAAAAGANDLVIAVDGETPEVAEEALQAAENALTESSGSGKAEAQKAKNLGLALEEMPGANMVTISVPGAFAKIEVAKALAKGVNVFLFSDNVTIEEEVELKTMALEKGLLMMGPDCGTSIINGACLGFANVINRGNIGIVGASGTGVQEVTVQIERWGGGCSQVIGVGGRDLKEKVGGLMFLEVMRRLDEDPATEVIVLISKPPAQAVMAKVRETIAQMKKPVVVNLLGGEASDNPAANEYFAGSLEEAAAMAVALANGTNPYAWQEDIPKIEMDIVMRAEDLAHNLNPSQKYVRGLFSGGTLCYEAMLLTEKIIGPVNSNVPLKPEQKLRDSLFSSENTCIDLGEDEFTVGRPHPMIDFQLRNERILIEAADPETAVILLDVVLGYGSNPDPAAELVPVIKEAQALAQSNERNIQFIGYVCGTDKDPQGKEEQIKKLQECGVEILPTNAHAALLASYTAAKVARDSAH